jgi:dephospho-CoA kinase
MKTINSNRGLIVGVTGGIACGKSTVTQLLADKGAIPIDADEIGHRLLKRGSPVIGALVNAFGVDVLDEAGNVSRSRLGAIVFSDKTARDRLNAILHPLIERQSRTEARRLANEDPNRIVLIDAALLIEIGAQRSVDVVVVVTTSPEIQLQRLINRSHAQGRPLTKAEAQARIDAQMPLSEKVKYADFVIENNGTIEELREQVDWLWRELLKSNSTKTLVSSNCLVLE